MKKIFVFLVVAFLLSSCAKDIVINYQSQKETGNKVEIKPTKNLYNTYLTINDSLFVDNKTVKSIKIDNMPMGPHTIEMKSRYTYYKDNIDKTWEFVFSGNETIKKNVIRPSYSAEYYMMNLLLLTPAFLITF